MRLPFAPFLSETLRISYQDTELNMKKISLVLSWVVVAACGGGEKSSPSGSTSSTATNATTSASPKSTPSASAASKSTSGASASSAPAAVAKGIKLKFTPAPGSNTKVETLEFEPSEIKVDHRAADPKNHIKEYYLVIAQKDDKAKKQCQRFTLAVHAPSAPVSAPLTSFNPDVDSTATLTYTEGDCTQTTKDKYWGSAGGTGPDNVPPKGGTMKVEPISNGFLSFSFSDAVIEAEDTFKNAKGAVKVTGSGSVLIKP